MKTYLKGNEGMRLDKNELTYHANKNFCTGSIHIYNNNNGKHVYGLGQWQRT